MAVPAIIGSAATQVAKYAPQAVKTLQRNAPAVMEEAKRWYANATGASNVNLAVAAKNPKNAAAVLTSLVRGGATAEQLSEIIPVLNDAEMVKVKRELHSMEVSARETADAMAPGISNAGVNAAEQMRQVTRHVHRVARAFNLQTTQGVVDVLTSLRMLKEADVEAYEVQFGKRIRFDVEQRTMV